MGKAITEQELRQYLEAERQGIARKYGRCDEETMRDFVRKHGPERFHDEYFRKHCFN